MNLLTVLVSGCVVLSAAGAGTPGATPQTPAKQGPRIAVEPADFDFGQARQNSTLAKDFVVRNLGDEDLRLEDVKTTCGCTAALPNERIVRPGGQTRLKVSLQTRSSEGRIVKDVIIKSNDPTKAVLAVKLSATVVPAAAGR